MTTEERKAIIKQAIKAGKRTVPEIASIMYPGMPSYNLTSRKSHLRALMYKMERDREIERDCKEGRKMKTWHLVEEA